MRTRHLNALFALVCCVSLALAYFAESGASSQAPAPPAPALDKLPAGWHTASPREEIRPAFSYNPTGGPKKTGAFVITNDEREGLHGYFHTTIPVTGGKHYRFH